MKEIIDNEIIKALECCNTAKTGHRCDICPFYEDERCTVSMLDSAVDLINRQKAEIERLKKRLDMGCKELSYSRKLNIQINDLNLKLLAERKTAKSEAIKEFAKRLKERFYSLEYKADTKRTTLPIDFVKDQMEWIFKSVCTETIDNLVKEMTESEDT